MRDDLSTSFCSIRPRLDAYHDDAGYIKALAQSINDYWMKNGRPNMLLLSFHGVPRRALEQGDPGMLPRTSV